MAGGTKASDKLDEDELCKKHSKSFLIALPTKFLLNLIDSLGFRV